MKDPWLGPYKIHRVCDKGVYELLNQEGNVLTKKENGINLKPFLKCNDSNKDASVEYSTERSRIEGYKDVNVVSQIVEAVIPLTTNNEVQYGRSGVTDEVFSFQPTTAAWRKCWCKQLSVPTPRNMAV